MKKGQNRENLVDQCIVARGGGIGMARIKRLIDLPKVQLNRSDPTPLNRQIERQLRELILSGDLRAQMRLPSTRQLADGLGCSRGTVVGAIEQLIAEGFLISSSRSGTFVVGPLRAAVDRRGDKQAARPVKPVRLSHLGEFLAEARRPTYRPGTAFSTGSPDVADFPFGRWSRLCRSVWRQPPLDAVYNQDPAGYLPLRRAIAAYLHDTRGTRFEPSNVFITSGSQQGLDLVARLLLNEGDLVWMEEPGFIEARYALRSVGAGAVAVPVDSEGLSVTEGRRRAADAKLAIVTPSHQYPMGMIMSYARRMELLDWARQAEAWILEDDYDSESRHSGAPLPALQALDADETVIYMGTFSKALFSSLRIGYLVLPPRLMERFCRARYNLDPFTSLMAQPVLTRFIEDGHFATYIQKIRRKFAARRESVVAAARDYFGDAFEFQGDKAGLYVTAVFSGPLRGRPDDEAARKALAAGVVVAPLSSYYQGPPTAQGLILGFGSIDEKTSRAGMATLSSVIDR
jgi:GntR family transcriptional regulator/MocR family aminotransferase